MLTFFRSLLPGKRRTSAAAFLRAGFTLVELLVVMAVVTIITMVLLVRQGRFDSSTLLRSLAYSTALSVRQAQLYGTSVSGTKNAGGAIVFASAYGVFFDSTNISKYILFADLDGDGQYSAGEAVKTFTFGTGYSLGEVCAIGTNSGGAAIKRCTGSDDTAGGGTITGVTVLFKRPNTDAVIKATGAGAQIGDSYSSAYVRVANVDGVYRPILVSISGQVVVAAPNTAP